MAWFKVDDKLHSAPKVMRIPRRYRLSAVGLWAIAGSWSADQLTDGHVPDYMIDEWGGNKTLVEWLVKVDLWQEVPEGSSFKNWAEYQPTKAEVEEGREKNREKLRKWRERNHGNNQGVTELRDGSDPVSNPAPIPTRPDPTRPDPIKEPEANASGEASRKRATRATRISDDFKVTDDMRLWASVKAEHVNLDLETEKFINFWISKSGKDATKLDWTATWRNWILNSRSGPSQPQRMTGSQQRLQQGLSLIEETRAQMGHQLELGA